MCVSPLNNHVSQTEKCGLLWPECVSVMPDNVDSERSVNSFLLAVLSLVKLTVHGRGQNDPQATGKCPGAPVRLSASVVVVVGMGVGPRRNCSLHLNH